MACRTTTNVGTNDILVASSTAAQPDLVTYSKVQSDQRSGLLTHTPFPDKNTFGCSRVKTTTESTPGMWDIATSDVPC